MFKYMVLFLTLSVLIFTLSACSSDTPEMKNTANLQKDAGVFVGMYGENNIDIEMKESKKMFSLSKEVETEIDSFELNDVVLFEYAQDDSGKLVIYSIDKVGVAKEEKEDPTIAIKEKQAQREIEKEKEKQKAKDEEDKEKEEKEEKESQFNIKETKGVTLQKEDGFETYILEKNPSYFMTVEEIDNLSDIKKDRWSAADVLNEVGNLRELVNQYIPHQFLNDASFVFTGYNDEETKIISVKIINDTRIRFTLTYPTNGDNLTQNELWDAVSSINP